MTLFPGNMKTKSKIAIVVFAASLFFPGLASAAVNTTLYIQGPGGTVLVNSALVVPESCTVVDNTGAAHDFSGHQAPCAIQAAKDTGLIADFVFRDFGGSLGLFLKSINGIADGICGAMECFRMLALARFSFLRETPSSLPMAPISPRLSRQFKHRAGPWL
jgi:hypothetical protein